MSSYKDAIDVILLHEGEHVVPDDNGRGASKWGVTLRTYREFHPNAIDTDIEQLGREDAMAFYLQAFWVRYRVGLIEDQAVATKLLDLIVNVGPVPGIKILQRAIGTPADGVLGHLTAEEVNDHEPSMVMQGIRTAGAQYYQELVQRRPEYARFLDGWLMRLNS